MDGAPRDQYTDGMISAGGLEIVARALGCGFLGLIFAYVGWALCARRITDVNTSARWSMTLLGALLAATLLFHLLALSGHFRFGWALLAALVLAAATHFGIEPFSAFVREFLRDARFAALALSQASVGIRIIAGVFGALLCIPVALTLIIPPLGWDAVSYHLAKAAMWVQSGRLETLQGPGGWSYYPLFPGGGELLYAWAMLPFHSDMVVCLTGAFFWLSAGLVTYALGRAIGLSRVGGGVCALWVLFTPAVHRMVGSGYVEPVLQLATTAMALCAILFLRRGEPHLLLLALAACGLMAGIKIMGLVLGAAGVFFLLIFIAWRRRVVRRLHWGAVIIGSAVAAALVLPWWGRAWAETGRPLSPLPIRVVGLALGVISPDLQWLQNRESAVFSWVREWETLKTLFIWDEDTPRLGLSWAVGFLLLPVGVWQLSRQRQGAIALFLLVMLGAFIAAYYHPDMLVLRTHWATTNARYWVQVLPLVAVLCAYGVEKALRHGRVFLAVVLVCVVAIHAQSESFWGAGSAVLSVVPLIAGFLFLGVILSVRYAAMGRARVWIGVGAVVGLMGLGAIGVYRDAMRWRIYADAGTMRLHSLLRYWVPAAESLDDVGVQHRIAVTSAPWQNGDNWLVYPFLGRRFQNMLVYVPISADGRIVPFDGSTRYLETSHAAAWLARLYKSKTAYVMSFWPPSVERYWMLQNREFFRPVWVGRKWGCFALRPWNEALQRMERADKE